MAAGVQGQDRTRLRLGRAVLFVLQQAPVLSNTVVQADIANVLLAGRAMDFAAKLQGYKTLITPTLAKEFARQAGLGYRDLVQTALPLLKKADVIDYALDSGGELSRIEEYVGLAASVIEQTFRVLALLSPEDRELALLHSVEIAAWAPLTESQHLGQIVGRGLSDAAAAEGLKLALSMGINRRIPSSDLNEQVVFNPHVWGTGQVKIATFLKSLPPNEREVLLGLCEAVSDRPGVEVGQLSTAPSVLASARKVGLIQAATVKSSAGGGRTKTYAFSPLVQPEDDQLTTTETLHQRKMFVAHILFGAEHAQLGRGRIGDPVILVSKLLERGQVGPASNISTDYHLLEAAGIVRVEEQADGKGLLKLIKREIVEGGLNWLRHGLGSVPTGSGAGGIGLHHVPGKFITPEADRAAIADEAAANEVTTAAILKLREEAKRAARLDSPFSF